MRVKVFFKNILKTGRKEVIEDVTNIHADISLNCIDVTYIYKDDVNVEFRTITFWNDKNATINIMMED